MSISIGIIGGSGLYDMAELTDREERRVETPFGEPSASYVIGTLGGKRVAFLARHGAGHRLLPSELNFRANIFGFKTLGVQFIVSASAGGRRQPEGGPQAARFRHPGSVPRSDEGPHFDVLRTWPGRARRVCAPLLQPAERCRVSVGRRRRSPYRWEHRAARAQGRHLCL